MLSTGSPRLCYDVRHLKEWKSVVPSCSLEMPIKVSKIESGGSLKWDTPPPEHSNPGSNHPDGCFGWGGGGALPVQLL